MKYNYVLILLILFYNNSLCTGINHEEKFENTYIIDVSSEDLHYFIEKLDWYLNKAKMDFYIFLIGVGISFIFTYIIIIYILKKIDKFLLLAILIFISFKPVSNKWKDTPCSCTERSNIVKMSKLPKAIPRFNATLLKISMTLQN